MGKEFDKDKGGMLNWINWLSEILTEVNRTLKPGALGLVWSIPRTSHWTGMAIELAGFRIIDIVHSCQGSGFPKGQDISKHIDQIFNAERDVIGTYNARGFSEVSPTNDGRNQWASGEVIDKMGLITARATEEAKHWNGWKTPALKPAIEGWWLIQKPISESSIARNILKHGVGGLNIEAGRIGTETKLNSSKPKAERNGFIKGFVTGTETEVKNYGRYPANLVLSCGENCDGANHSPDCPVTVIGDQSGVSSSNATPRNRQERADKTQYRIGGDYETKEYGDKGSAARFFKQFPFDTETTTSIYYQAKASKSDRTCNGKVQNTHPTIKSRHLLSYFLKLITPPGGIVLDCFGGSGTTAVSAIESGFNYVVIEKEPEYIEIINQRIAATKGEEKPIAVPSQPETPNQEPLSESTPTQQLSLF